MRRIVRKGKRHYERDCRYDLQNVTAGFAQRVDKSTSDEALLDRICIAYHKAVTRQQSALPIYDATEWWAEIRRRSLAPVRDALLARDLGGLRRMYGNFFRDPCSTGLVGVPYGMSRAYFGGKIKDLHRQFYLADCLRRIDYWKKQCGAQYTLHALAGPNIGNPFGITIAGTFVRDGAAYQHYCAYRIFNLLGARLSAVAEIGGGFGGMAYYLLRDHPRISYLDLDVPESLALASYYLMTALPHLRFMLYGEGEITDKAIAEFDVILMPLFELPAVPDNCVDLSFSSHALSDVSTEASVNYLDNIARTTRKLFYNIGVAQVDQEVPPKIYGRWGSFSLAESRASGWNGHKNPAAVEVECVYRVRKLEGIGAGECD